jgi:hypothetical protein
LEALLKLREREGLVSRYRRHTKVGHREIENSLHRIAFMSQKIEQNRFSIKHYENVRDVVSKNNSTLLNYNYRAKFFTKCQSATTKVNE